MKISLIASLAVLSACQSSVGNFCDVMTAPIYLDEAAARAQLGVDRRPLERLATLNEYGDRNCGW